MQLDGFHCPTQSFTKSITRGYVAVINDALIALIVLANFGFLEHLARELAHYRPIYWRKYRCLNVQ